MPKQLDLFPDAPREYVVSLEGFDGGEGRTIVKAENPREAINKAKELLGFKKCKRIFWRHTRR